MSNADIGLIGLAVMGQNLALNIADHGFKVAVFNRTTATMEQFVSENPSTPGGLVGCKSLADLLASLKKPRKIIILVKAGAAVDDLVQQLIAAGVEQQDLVIDCGNSQWTDTIRREKQYADKLRYFGSGVSGGELGARFGPALMPGGNPESWKHLEPIWNAIAAKVDPKTGRELLGAEPGKPIKGGVPCCAYLGPNGAGHYVKMVHNGIEYIDMQLIAESYDILRQSPKLNPGQISDIFADWNEGELGSYLIQITADVLRQRDPASPRKFLVDSIVDAAGQKGTGKWTSVNALDMGIPAACFAEAVFARYMSAIKDERVTAAKSLKGPKGIKSPSAKVLVGAVRDALYLSKICAYAQGFQLMRQAQVEYKWKLDFGQIASVWRGGCIIRARFLQKITEAFTQKPDLVNLMLSPYFRKEMASRQENWRKVVALAAHNGIAAPAMFSALSYFDSYRAAVLPANLIQGQRDYFGAHTYERTDQPRGKFFHIDWPLPKRPQIAI